MEQQRAEEQHYDAVKRECARSARLLLLLRYEYDTRQQGTEEVWKCADDSSWG
jgi:hypothetical protein